MQLVDELINDIEVQQVMRYFRLNFPEDVEDLTSAFNMLAKYSFGEVDRAERIHNCALMCRHMEPDIEDAVAVLLGYYLLKEHIKEENFRRFFDTRNVQKYCNYIINLCKKLNKDKQDKKSVDYLFMHHVCDKMVEKMIKNLKKYNVVDEYCIQNAYSLASEAHYGVVRQSGEPYITHPVMVAKILADVRVESSIIAAALLHDVLEDSKYTYKDIETKCSKQIAQYVEAVTSLHRRYAEAHLFRQVEQLTEKEVASVNLSDKTGADDEADISDDVAVVSSETEAPMQKAYYSKLELDELSFDKLVKSVSSEDRMIFSLYIKAADRIHNLSTIDVMSSEKKHKKTDETELDYLPLFKRFHLQYYVDRIEDLTWRTNNVTQYNDIEQAYNGLCRKNAQEIDGMVRFLERVFADPFNKCCSLLLTEDAFDVTIRERKYRPLEIYNMLKGSVDGFIEGRMISKDSLNLCDIDIILDPLKPTYGIEDFIGIFTRLNAEEIAPSGRIITDCGIDGQGRFVVCFEDGFSNRFRCCFWLREQYWKYVAGGRKGMFIKEDDEPVRDGEDTIRVFLKDNAQRILPKGSTVLDLACMIHGEVFFSAKGAFINDQPAPIYSILHDGDRVVIDADTSRGPNGYRFVRHARIDWLFHVKTAKAQKRLKQFLEDKYEGDNPLYEECQPDNIVLSAAKEIIDQFFGAKSSQ